jgi:hypothetical protein
MRKLTLLGATALLASAMAFPALAQDATNSPGRCENGKCQHMGAGTAQMRSSTGHLHHRAAYRTNKMQREAMNGGQREAMGPGYATGYGYSGPNGYYRNGYYRNGYYYGPYQERTGFWPADVAAGAVGAAGAVAAGAVNTAGAIATAPFRAGESYAYYNNGWDHRTWAQRNNFVCTPGQYFKGADGQRHMCQ